MTEKPYTDADVDLVHDAMVDARLQGLRDWTDRPARAVLDALTAAGRLAAPTSDLTDRLAAALADVIRRCDSGVPFGAGGSRHTGWIRADVVDGWRALLAEHACPCKPDAPEHRHGAGGYTPEDVNTLLANVARSLTAARDDDERAEAIEMLLSGWYAAWPDSAVTDPHAPLAGELLRLLTGQPARGAPAVTTPTYVHHLLDAFLTGQPLNFHRDPVPLDVQRRLEHAVATGQMGTAPGPDWSHEIAFDTDGTWTLEHPTGCRTAEHDFDCRVRQLAERQITSDLAQLMAGGRYTCFAGDLGDLFQLGERLHDDQCTTPVCAACGCWCHAEEQTEEARTDG
ncbi:hypothetical protein AB0C02_28010 [Micromonospora sp. NPDC048999]|uniref:hypothetical protein n=1 Tax=Micromonospora sp. NPDC048999 TaxID=3155391 RepID=UPI0033C948B5